ncbi:MAG TPA: ABC transporter ATP-binding protein [Roseiflexaceae bacterium]|nr:ABC transporter ATP-binding protein [Roseiflexaceae bacterium]
MSNSRSSVRYAGVLRRYLAPYRWRLFLLLALLLVGAATTLLLPQLLARFIDAVFQAGAPSQLIGLGGLFLGLALVNQAVGVTVNYLGTDIGLRTTNRIRSELTMHCLELDMAFHHATTPGALIERVDGDVAKLNQFLATFAVLLLRNALLILGAVGAVFLIDWRAGLAVAIFVGVVLGALNGLRRLAIPSITRERAASAELFGLVEERLAGAEDIRANGAVAFAMRRFAERSQPWAQHTMVSHTLGAVGFQLANVLFVGGLAVALGMGAWLLSLDAISIGGVYVIYRYVELMRWPLMDIGRQVQDLQQAGAAIGRVEELLGLGSAVGRGGTQPLPAGALGLEVAGVSFAYSRHDEGWPALAEVSFALAPGATLGLLGRTGSGKSSVARLLTRQYLPQAGAIRLGGVPLDAVAPDSLRARVALVTQDVRLFTASVRDNLTLFDPAYSDEQLHAALRDAQLWEWYEALPAGLDTPLLAEGGMSAGQAQLLAFARVLLRDPGLVILDEASARLDPATEKRLDVAIDRLLQGRSAIIIAHRISTVQRADQIVILEGGRVAEAGPRVALAADPASRFTGLLRAGLEEVAR